GTPYLDTSWAAYYQNDGFVTRYDSSGLLQWMHQLYTIDAWGVEVTPSLCLDDGLELYSSTYGTSGSNIGMNKVSQFAYANTYYGSTQMGNYTIWNVNQILNDPTSNLPVKIGFHDSIPGFQYAYKKMVVWRGNNMATFSTGGQYIGLNGAVDSQGNIYVVNSMQPVYNGVTYCMIAKLDSNLNMLWNKQIGEGSAFPPFGTLIDQLKVDTNGSLLLCGRFMDTLDIDISPNTYNLVSNGDYDAFIARFDTAANFIWAQSFGGADDDYANSITTDLNGRIYLGGSFSSPTIDLDPTAGISFLMKGCVNADWQGGYISKFKPDGTFMKAMGSGKNITELEFKAPKRIYATGIPFLQVFELGNDVIVNVSDTICAGDSVVVGNSVYYQTGVYTAIFPIAPAIDSIVITNLTVNPLPLVVANASDTSLCIGDSVVLFGSGANTYVWNNAVMDNVIFSPLATNNYLVTGTDINGCVNQDSIQITVNALPAITANATDTITCFGDSIILFGSGGVSYTWNNLVIDSVLFTPLATGYFVVTGTDTNGCVNTDSIEVIVHTLPLAIANASDTSLCPGDSVMLFGTGALTYTWNNLVTDSLIFSPNITNTYLVAGTDTNGCVNTDSITVVVNALPNVVANASDTSLCIGNPVTLYGTGADSFSWTNSVIDSVAFYPIDTSMYVVTGIDVNGCVNQDSILVSAHQIPVPVLVFSGDTLYCTNVTGVTYYWFKDTVAVDSLINYYVVTQNGNYQVLVVDSNGCVGADTISILNLGNLNLDRFSQINVYPNPAHDELTIVFEMHTDGDVEFMISDLTGKNLYFTKKTISISGKQKQKIDLRKLNINSGIYFLNMMIEGKRHVVKIELQKG
ncbi:MAG: T9SS type A sorting domain-containing protein, partial [Chitinophagaceae bacterium]|nr:T9SS type A sorting domain-containing protein [Chitinophagaceae bacterium]